MNDSEGAIQAQVLKSILFSLQDAMREIQRRIEAEEAPGLSYEKSLIL